MEENKKDLREVKEYKIMTKKIETILTVVTLMLFMFSFSGGNAAGIAFFVVAGVILLYYFVVFRKKQHYVVIDGDQVTVYDGIMLTPVVIKIDCILKVTKTDKTLSIQYKENNTEKSIELRAFLLDNDDYNDIYNKLSRK